MTRLPSIVPLGGGRFQRFATLKEAMLRPGVVAAAFVLLSIAAGVQRIMLGTNVIIDGRSYTHYNNYLLFKTSFFHLVRGQDLYALYPAEYWDLYKYSPTFAALMAPFAALPDAVGVVAWSLLGSLVLFAGFWRLPMLDERSRMAAAWFTVLPLLQSLQNTQSNALLAGLMILGFVCLERNHPSRAALAIALAFFIKIYGGAALVLALFYPNRVRFAALFVLWTLVLGLVPLGFVSPSQLVFDYQSWARLLAADHTASTGVSVMSWLHNWFGVDPPKTAVAAIGVVVMLVPFGRFRAFGDRTFRLLVLAALLIWVVIFNHKAEPSTFVIAVAGVALWYYAQPRSSWHLALFGAVFVFTCLSTTSVFPTFLRRRLVQPFSLRVVPCILVWAVAVFEAMRRQQRQAAS